MAAEPDDWRRQGQERLMPPGTVFVKSDYRAASERDEHEHCTMCWAKFMDPQFSESHAQFIADQSEVLTAGLRVTGHERSDLWVCNPCFDDFAVDFGWIFGAA